MESQTRWHQLWRKGMNFNRILMTASVILVTVAMFIWMI